MEITAPFFSIVLPTLNRASYLPLAIQTVLNQTFTDFELIISNNSSTDNTEDVISSFEDSRIRYVKTDEQIRVGRHFEFALSHARGQYITFLGDDDGYSKIFLESMKETINTHQAKIVGCKMCKYFYFQVNNYDGQPIERNSIHIPAFTNETSCFESKEAVNNMFAQFRLVEGDVDDSFHPPQLVNAVYHHSLLREIKEKLGVIFPDLLPCDYYTAVTLLSRTDKYCFLDSPLFIHGYSENGTSIVSDKSKSDEYREKNPEYAKLENAPLKVFDIYNCSVDALLQAKKDLQLSANDFPFEFTKYFIVMYFNIKSWEEDGYDVSPEMETFFRNLSEQLPEVREAVLSRIFNWKSKVKNTFGFVLKSSGLLKYYRQFGKEKKRIIISGSEGNFQNILECSQSIDKSFLSRYGQKRTAAD